MTTKKKASAAKVRESDPSDDMRPEYDFRKGVRGKYASRYPHGSIVVTLDPDVAAAYPSAAAVNQALRDLIRGAPTPTPRRRRSA
jgi:hypothetical protein